MSRENLQAIDGGKHVPAFLAEIQHACKQRANEIRRNPSLAAEIDRRSDQTHATVRAAEEAMRRPPSPPVAGKQKHLRLIGDDQI